MIRTILDTGTIRCCLVGYLRPGMVPHRGAHVVAFKRFVVMKDVTVPRAHFADAAQIVFVVVQGRL